MNRNSDSCMDRMVVVPIEDSIDRNELFGSLDKNLKNIYLTI